MQHNYPGFSSAAVTRAAFQGINSYQVPIYFTWVECGQCRSMSCQRTLVQRRDSNSGPCDRQSGDVSTRPQHLLNVVNILKKLRACDFLLHLAHITDVLMSTHQLTPSSSSVVICWNKKEKTNMITRARSHFLIVVVPLI